MYIMIFFFSKLISKYKAIIAKIVIELETKLTEIMEIYILLLLVSFIGKEVMSTRKSN